MPRWRSALSAGDRYEAELSGAADELLSEADHLVTEAEHLPRAAVGVVAGPTHLAVMRAVDLVFTIGLRSPNANEVPKALRGAVRLLRRLQPLMLEELAKVPEAEVLDLMRRLARSIDQVADSVDPNYVAPTPIPDGDADSTTAGADQPSAA